MAFDPNQPTAGTLTDAVQMRAQLNALNDNINGVAGSIWPQCQLFLNSDDMHDFIIGNSANNVDGIQPLTQSISNPPTQAQVLAIQAKLNELINGTKH
jgi:hypothetical protein